MSDSTQRPPRGLAGDIHRARSGAKATAAELSEFVREFRGRNPQEMLGLVAGSSLVQSTIVATVITVALMAVFTFGPFYFPVLFGGAPTETASVHAVPSPPSAAPAAPAAPVAASSASGSAAPVAVGSTPAAVAPTGLGAPPEPGVPSADAVNKLGIGEAKSADPKKNPLESGTDDLLKDLK